MEEQWKRQFERGKQSSGICRSGHCFCCISKDAYFSSPYHVAKEVIMTKCYAVKEQTYIKCISFFDPTEPDDSYFTVTRAMTKGQPVLQHFSWVCVCQLRTDGCVCSNWRLKELSFICSESKCSNWYWKFSLWE